MKYFHPYKKKRSGFSLVELQVAMAITSVITILLFTLVGQSTASYGQTQRAVNTLSQARAFVQFFERELSTHLPGTPIIHEGGALGSPESSDKIAFVRSLSRYEQDASTPGDLGTSAYYVAFTSDRGTSVSPKLFRKTLNPVETQALIEPASAPSIPDPDPLTDEVIIDNILSFRAIPQFHDPATGELVDWDETSPEEPTTIALTIQFIDESSAMRFSSEAEWNRLATNPRDNERQLIRTFTRLILISK